MGTSRQIAISVLAAALLTPAAALADSSLALSFTGIASQGFNGSVFGYIGPQEFDTSFAGQPVKINMTITNYATDAFVSQFSVSWSNQTFTAPFLTGWSASGELQTDDDIFDSTFFSTVSLGSAGGSISISPSSGFIAETDADFELNMTYTTGGPHPVGSSFQDSASGCGSIGTGVTDDIDPAIGPYDAESNGGFTVSGVRAAVVPEPRAWALLIVGFGAIGGPLRLQRRARERQTAATA